MSVLGKAEGTGIEWHGHVTALTVAPEYRRLSLARKMTSLLEMVSEEIYKGFFVDLYVRCANLVAIGMYEGMGYSVYRRVREYYGTLGMGKGGRDDEDAFGMSYLMSSPFFSKFASRHAQTFGSRPKPSLSAAKWEGYNCKRTRRVITPYIYIQGLLKKRKHITVLEAVVALEKVVPLPLTGVGAILPVAYHRTAAASLYPSKTLSFAV